MTFENGNGRASGVNGDLSIAKVAAAERFATAVVLGFEVCEDADAPLSQRQKIAVIEAALLEFDGLEAQLRSLASVSELLRAFGPGGETWR
jgi:hypothetical protein